MEQVADRFCHTVQMAFNLKLRKIMKKQKRTDEEFGLLIEFGMYWREKYAHVEQCLNDDEALSFIKSRKTIEQAVDAAVDYVLSQGLREVQE